MSQSPKIVIKNLLLLGTRKNYRLPEFKEGLNVIHGSTDTGKSMILRLIAYGLGKNKLTKRVPEIDKSCTHVVIEIEINGEKITIKRDILKESEPIELFFGGIDKVKGKPDKLVHIRGTQKLGTLSDFLLQRMNVPNLVVPYAPNDANKGYNSVSLPDIINLIYLNDEEIGNGSFLGRTNPFKHNKYMESLKALLRIEDVRFQELQATRGRKNNEKNELERYIKEVKKFLISSKILNKGDIEYNIQNVLKEIKQTNSTIADLNKQIQEKSFISKDLNNELLSKKESISKRSEEIKLTEIKLMEFRELLKSYDSSIDKKQSLLELKDLEECEGENTCPVCNSIITETAEINTDFVNGEIIELKHKQSDLSDIIKENEILVQSSKNELLAELEEIKKLEEKASVEIKTYLSPLLQSRDEALMELGRQKELLNSLSEKKKTIEEYETQEKTLERITKEIEDLDSKINLLKKNLKEKDAAIAEISKNFSEFINDVKQTSASNASIDTNFIPHITIEGKNLSYYQVSGTAKKVVLCVAYYTALFKYCLKELTYLPSLLIIDSPSTGRGTNPQDPAEEWDIKVYENMFQYWKKLVKEEGVGGQIIIVDSTMPPEDVKGSILVTFDKTGKDGQRRGLIDDLDKQISL